MISAGCQNGLDRVVQHIRINPVIVVPGNPARRRLPPSLQDSRDGFYRNLRHPLSKASQPSVDLPDLFLLLLDQLFQDLLLFPYNIGELDIHNLRIELAAHQSCSFVLFDISRINRLGQLQIFAESLLLEISDGMLISKGKEVIYSVSDMVILDVIHQMRAVALHLLVAGHRAENNLGESLTRKCPEADSANRSPALHQRQGLVLGAASRRRRGRGSSTATGCSSPCTARSRPRTTAA